MNQPSPVRRKVADGEMSIAQDARRMRVGRGFRMGGGCKPLSRSERVEALCGGVCATLARGYAPRKIKREMRPAGRCGKWDRPLAAALVLSHLPDLSHIGAMDHFVSQPTRKETE